MAWIRIEEGSSTQGDGALHHSPEWLVFGLIAIAVAGFLAMVATWFLVDYYPIPDDDAVYLSLLGFLFVLFFDFVLIFRFVGSKLRQGQLWAAIKWSVGLVLLGLLAASVVGSLPLLWRRLTTALPWMHEIPWGILLMLLLLANSLWLRRSTSKGPDRRVRPRDI